MLSTAAAATECIQEVWWRAVKVVQRAFPIVCAPAANRGKCRSYFFTQMKHNTNDQLKQVESVTMSLKPRFTFPNLESRCATVEFGPGTLLFANDLLAPPDCRFKFKFLVETPR